LLGLIFFDPELRRGLAHNAERVHARVPAGACTPKPHQWFLKMVQTVTSRVAPGSRLRRDSRSKPWSSRGRSVGRSPRSDFEFKIDPKTGPGGTVARCRGAGLGGGDLC
jgi:hypothetical protein